MEKNIYGIPYGGKVYLDPKEVQQVGKVIHESAEKVSAEYEELIELEDKLCTEMGGDVAINFENAIENIDQYMEETKKILLEIAETVEDYADYMKEADLKAAGGVCYEPVPMQ